MLLIVGGMEAAAADSSLCSSLFSVSGASGASVGSLVVTSGEGACFFFFCTLCDLLRGVSMARADSGGLICWLRSACWIGLMPAVVLGATMMAPGALSWLEVSVSSMLLVPSTIALSTLTRDLCINSDAWLCLLIDDALSEFFASLPSSESSWLVATGSLALTTIGPSSAGEE